MAGTKTASPRRRNAAATRAAILESARRAFVARGYDGAGVREIAEGAGVTAMLVNRYFGSKEKLFAEVVAAAMAAPSILTQENVHAPDAGARIAREMIAATEAGATPLDGFQIMLRSASSPRAAEIVRVEIEKRHQKTLTDAMAGKDAALRAALVLALSAGIQVMRQMVELPALAKADPAALQRVLAPVMQLLVRGG